MGTGLSENTELVNFKAYANQGKERPEVLKVKSLIDQN
jgi:hypothetical protein